MGREIQKVIVDRAYKAGGFAAYADLADRLKISRATLSQWRNGSHPIPDRRLEQLCEISGDDVGVVALAIMAERTNITSLRKSIRGILDKAGAVFVFALLLLPHQVEATVTQEGSSSAPMGCIMRSVAAYCRWLRAALRTVRGSIGMERHDNGPSTLLA